MAVDHELAYVTNVMEQGGGACECISPHAVQQDFNNHGGCICAPFCGRSVAATAQHECCISYSHLYHKP